MKTTIVCWIICDPPMTDEQERKYIELLRRRYKNEIERLEEYHEIRFQQSRLHHNDDTLKESKEVAVK